MAYWSSHWPGHGGGKSCSTVASTPRSPRLPRGDALEELREPILRLALLAPDLVEAILAGWADQRVMLERLERPLPMGWEEQREHIIS